MERNGKIDGMNSGKVQKGRRHARSPRSQRARRRRRGRIAAGFLTAFLVLLLSTGLAAVVLYKSGEAALRASAARRAPVIELDEMGQNAAARLQSDFIARNAIPWQEDWVAYEGKIYEYKEETLNLLLLGIDHGGELGKQTDLSDWGAGQADSIFLVSLDQRSKRLHVIGIPRNAMVEVEIYNEKEQCIDTIYNQICLQYGYAGGGVLGLVKMKECVSGMFYQLPIHGVCAISFDAVGIAIEMLGGVEVTIQEDMTGFNAKYTQGSTLTLTRKNAMPYLRYRDTSALGSPTTRLTRQKAFLQAAIAAAVDKMKHDPMLVRRIYEAVAPYMNTDITLDKAVYLAAQSLDCNMADNSFYQLTGEDRQVDFISDEGLPDFYDDYYLDEETLRRTVIEVFYREVIWQPSK